MRILNLCFIFLLLSVSNVYSNETDSLLYILEDEINNKEKYIYEKETRIKNLKSMFQITNLDLEQKYDIYYKIYKEFNKYQVDSAIYYSNLCLETADLINDKKLLDESKLSKAILYSTRGLYIEALDITNSVNRQSLDKSLISQYYRAYSLLYGQYIQSNNVYSLYDKLDEYSDSLVLYVEPASINYAIVYAQKEMYRLRNLDEAEKVLLSIYRDISPKSGEYGTITFLLGDVYKYKGNKELQKKFYLLSAISDIRNVVKDNASLQSLALLLYEQGNIDLAYKCIKSSLEDAIFCNVRYRTIENSNTYPIITGTYQLKEKYQKDKLELFLVLISILSVIVIITLIYIYKQMKRVAKIRKELYRANQRLSKLNDNLQQVNLNLKEANNIKKQYFAYSFDLCSNYIDKIEKFKNSLNKRLQTNRIDDVAKILSSDELISVELKEFYHNFDKMFLGIYPTFVEEFNRLLIDPEKLKIKEGELLSPELRIFALIKLGIKDSARIANYLHYSMSTIYNYRTKMKSKSIIPKDEFEDRVMLIGNIYSTPQ